MKKPSLKKQKIEYLQIFALAIIFLFSIFAVHSGKAQPIDFAFQHLTQDDGLTSNKYNSFVTKDSRGLVWIGSTEGINCFDGIHITHYQENAEHPDGMLGNLIQSKFYEDIEGNLWFATYQALNWFDRKKNDFHHIQILGADGNKIIEDYQVFFINKKEHFLLLKAGKEIFRLDTQDPTSYESYPYFVNGKRFTVDCNEEGVVERIYSCSWGNHGVTGIELLSIDSSGKMDYNIYLDKGIPEKRISPPTISQAIYQNDTLVWLVSGVDLLKFDRRNPNQATLINAPEESIYWEKGLLLKDRYLLLSSSERGLWLLDTYQNQFTAQNWKHISKGDLSPASNAPRAMDLDSQDFLWVSHFINGLDYAYVYDNFFKNISIERLKGKYGVVKTLREDEKNNIWCAVNKEGVFTFNQNEAVDSWFLSSNTIPSGENDFKEIQYLCQDKVGQFWSMSKQNLFSYNDSDQIWEERYKLKEGSFSFMLHLKNGRVLITTSKGLFDLVEENGVFELIKIKEFKDYEGYNFIRLYQHSKGDLYISYNSSELWIYESVGSDFKKKKELKINASIFSFWEDKETEKIWMGTSKGLLWLDTKDYKYGYTLKENGRLGTSNIYGVLGDKKGRLWMSSNRGIWSYNPKDSTLLQYRKGDGLATNGFSEYGCLAASDGKLWFGNNEGLTVFHPDSIQPFPYPPQVYFNRLMVNNSPYEGEVFISEETSISLPFNENTLTFDLTAVGNYMPKHNHLRYRLREYDNDWVTIPNGSTARFTKLPAGHFVFEVIAINANGVESEIKSLAIEIRPPMWKEPWFLALGTLLLAFILYRGFKFFVNKKLRKQQLQLERQQALTEERNRIAQELHDDMGAGLSAIRYLSEYVLEDEEDEDNHTRIERIYASTGNLLQNMRDIIWALDRGKDSLDNLLIHLRSYCNEYLSTNELPCTVHISSFIPDIELSGERRRNILLIVKECLHNIVKHAVASEVKISFKVLKKESLCIIIKDNGKGFYLPEVGKIGNGLRNMKNRADVLKAEIIFDSSEGKGTEVKVRIPLQ